MRLNLNYTERYKSLRIHTQRSACLTLFGNFNINDSKGKYAIYYDAVYSSLIVVFWFMLTKYLYKLSNILKKVFKANIKLKCLKYILFAFLPDL